MRGAVAGLLLLLPGLALATEVAQPTSVSQPAPASQPAAPPRPASTLVVAIDPGHGGEKEGAHSVHGPLEKDLVLQIARRLEKLLVSSGARVVMTRQGDEAVALRQRTAIANAAGADLLVSVHLNSTPRRGAARGAETYFLSADATDASASALAARENADRLAGELEAGSTDTLVNILEDLEETANHQESSRLAKAVHARVAQVAGSSSRGVRQAPFTVLAGARMPAILVELGFLSHAGEARELATPERQEALARAIAEAIAEWRSGGGTGI